MRVVALLVLVYLCGGAFTYAKVWEDSQGPGVTNEQSRGSALDAAYVWPLFWAGQLRQ